jgi:ElaB/YqjD/DUF883 family membrane-anchored ribosome-binding protein
MKTRPYAPLLQELEQLLDEAWSDELADKNDAAKEKVEQALAKIWTLEEVLEEWLDDIAIWEEIQEAIDAAG